MLEVLRPSYPVCTKGQSDAVLNVTNRAWCAQDGGGQATDTLPLDMLLLLCSVLHVMVVCTQGVRCSTARPLETSKKKQQSMLGRIVSRVGVRTRIRNPPTQFRADS